MGTEIVISKDWVYRFWSNKAWMYLFFIFYAHTVIRINFLSLIFNICTKIWKSPIFLERRKWKTIHKSTPWPDYGPPSLKLITVPKRELNLLQGDISSNKSFKNWRKYGMRTERTAKSPIFLGVTVHKYEYYNDIMV